MKDASGTRQERVLRTARARLTHAEEHADPLRSACRPNLSNALTHPSSFNEAANKCDE